MGLNRTSKLEAVNAMLTSIGEAPINSISALSSSQDSAIALSTLEATNREVQMVGWYFNSETNVKLVRDSNNYIPIAQNVMDVDPDTSEHPFVNITMRGGYLYDLAKETSERYTFDDDITADVIYLLEFTDLPQAARHYITTKASRIFADRVVGSGDLSKMLRQDELTAFEYLNEYEARSADASFLDDPSSTQSRNRYI